MSKLVAEVFALDAATLGKLKEALYP